jgi:hypothetical protein
MDLSWLVYLRAHSLMKDLWPAMNVEADAEARQMLDEMLASGREPEELRKSFEESVGVPRVLETLAGAVGFFIQQNAKAEIERERLCKSFEDSFAALTKVRDEPANRAERRARKHHERKEDKSRGPAPDLKAFRKHLNQGYAMLKRLEEEERAGVNSKPPPDQPKE